jgi:LacI family transcriptional regulator
MPVPKSGVSVKDVAALAGVSVGTVSNVVNSSAVVSEATRTRVEDAIAKLGWVRNESARQLRAGRSRSIGMVVMDIGNPFFTDIVGGVEDYVQDLGFTVQLGNSAQQASRELRQLKLFEEQRVRGVMLAPIGGIGERVARLRRQGIPVVLVDRAEGADICSVSVDDVEGGRLAVSHLVDLGHEQVAFVGGPSSLRQVRDRALGAQLAVSRLDAAGALLTLSTQRLDTESGVAAAGELALMSPPERPTAVFAANDLLAIGLLQGFVTHGLRVPQDIAIIGYDDIAFAAGAAVPLSSIRQPRRLLGRRAAELLFLEVEALEQDLPHQHQQVEFLPELVVRRSTVGARGGRGATAGAALVR